MNSAIGGRASKAATKLSKVSANPAQSLGKYLEKYFAIMQKYTSAKDKYPMMNEGVVPWGYLLSTNFKSQANFGVTESCAYFCFCSSVDFEAADEIYVNTSFRRNLISSILKVSREE